MIAARVLAGNTRCRAVIAVALLGLALASSAPARSTGQAQLLPEAKATDCASCHASDDPLPGIHPPIAGMTLDKCAGCHVPGSARDLGGILPLSHKHFLSGVTCTACHADPKAAEEAPAKICMGCHDPDQVATASAAMKPTNPHNSPHYGKQADCNLCHHQHQKSENYCSQCHRFDFKVP